MEKEVMLVSITCQGKTMASLLSKFSDEINSFVDDYPNSTVSLTQNGIVEKVLTETGRLFQGSRTYEITVEPGEAADEEFGEESAPEEADESAVEADQSAE